MSDPQQRRLILAQAFEELLKGTERASTSLTKAKIARPFASPETKMARARAAQSAFQHLQAQDGCITRTLTNLVLPLRLECQRSRSRRLILLRFRSSMPRH